MKFKITADLDGNISGVIEELNEIMSILEYARAFFLTKPLVVIPICSEVFAQKSARSPLRSVIIDSAPF